MNRIAALNGDSDSCSSDEDDTHVTQEAQETIAYTEYMRALQLKGAGNVQLAESLFGELLETKVLNEAKKDAKENKMFNVKYSCLKNLGLICAEREDNRKAIEYLLDASDLDDTDVSLMHRLGKLALAMDQTHIAQMAFRKCLRQNPNHWPSADGMLRVLCLREDYAEAYGWALTWYDKNRNYQYGLDVILEIREKLDGLGLEYCEKLWKIQFTDTHRKRTNKETVFPQYIMADPEPIAAPDLTGLYLDDANLSWLSVGQLIVDMYEKFQDTSFIAYDMTLDEWLGRNVPADVEAPDDARPQPMDCDEAAPVGTMEATNVKSVEQMSDESQSKENSSSNNTDSAMFAMPPGATAAAEGQANTAAADISGTEESDGGASAAKPKASRRRGGGDLVGLEQWGWHKNKRYSQRKKSLDKTDADSTINGMLRKALGTFFEEQFDANESPFDSIYSYTSTEVPADRLIGNIPAAADDPGVTLSAFLLATQDDFVAFMTELKERPYFDMMVLVLKWCQYIARYWNQSLPGELQAIYMKLYIFHLNNWNIMSWNQLARTEFQAVFRMTMFYLELFHNRAMLDAKDGFRNDLDPQWRMLFNHLMFYTGFFEPDEHTQAEYDLFEIRWNWLMYLQARYENELDLAVDCLYSTEQLVKAAGGAPLTLPNCAARHNRITIPKIAALKIHLERFIRLYTVPQLYHDKKYPEIVPILVDSLHTIDWRDDPIALAADAATISPIKQQEILLECFWMMDSCDELLMWCESSLTYALGHFLKAPADTQRLTRWGAAVTFVLRYLVGVFATEPISIVEQMGRYGCRLVQNLARIVVHQLDGTFDKNNNRTHAIDIKLPWVLLHSLIERVELVQYGKLRRAAYLDATVQYRAAEGQAVPMSVMMFFTVHEFLGHRSWCTQNDGEMLLYVMDMVADRLRSAALDRHRDVLAEYLEQVTYCLYGYPAKRARARHIEEHDACNVELTWPRAVQLFNLYRPETLPEFNSYKNDSISADMEQLLQRIVALIPVEIDPAALTAPIQDFITGTLAELSETTPTPSAETLPRCMHCIHYLLADHYFKNRDLVKSVKYYILDLALSPRRFDAWAGLALSKASVLETKLNACTAVATNEFLAQCEESLRCFQQCFRLDDQQVPLWIEFGNFAYTMHSYCSRSLKQASETLSMERFEFMENKKEQCLKTAADCFNTVNAHNASAHHAQSAVTNNSTANNAPPPSSSADPQTTTTTTTTTPSLTNGNGTATTDDSHDEKWLHHYMLGKVAEKRKEPPDAVIAHYTESAKCLYEHSASYPFKISHSNPQHLSVEALEVYYRTTASIVKYLEHHATITRAMGRLFMRVLRELNASPFALNQAKIDGNSINALKRKTPTLPAPLEGTSNAVSDASPIFEAAEPMVVDANDEPQPSPPEGERSPEPPTPMPTDAVDDAPKETEQLIAPPPAGKTTEENLSPSRRGSQESNMTTTTNGTTATTATTTTGTSDTSSSSSSDSSSDESVSSDDSDDDSTEEDSKSADTPLSETELEAIYKTCIKNLEECVTRFPEHYKSIYRLVNIYLHAPERIRDLKRSKQLLLGTYTTGLGNHVQGLFVDRKQNNFFNGVWRIPSSEIDRPGSFAAHLSKCTIVLMEVLRLSADHKVLLELALQLHKCPDSDKRYIRDVERLELFQQALSFCTQSIRQLLKEHGVDRRNDGELILLLLDIYKAHKKYLKYTALKECPFSALLSDAYRVYLEGKLGGARLPEQLNATDYAIRFCQHEIGLRKNLAKNGGALPAPAQPESFLPAHVMRSLMNPPVVVAPPQVSSDVSVTAVSSAPPSSLPPSTAVSNAVSVAVSPALTSGTEQQRVPITTHEVTLTAVPTDAPPTLPLQSVPQQQSERVVVTVAPKSTPAYSAPSSALPASPRPRGRPPGSKNSTPSAGSSAHANLMAPLPYGQIDATTMAAILGIYKNAPLIPPMAPQFNDPNAMAALLSEYYKLTNLTGMSAVLANSNPSAMLPLANASPFSHNSSPSTSGSPSKLPMFDINSLISSAAEKMIPTSPSTVVNIGSGQLTITPSALGTQSARSGTASSSSYKPSKTQQSQRPPTSSQMFSDMPGISVTKVKPKNSKSTLNLPKDLPKSLTITPAPPIAHPATSPSTSATSSYSHLPNMQQYSQLQMKHETRPYNKTNRAPRKQNRQKKMATTMGAFGMHSQLPSMMPGPSAFASSASSLGTPSPYGSGASNPDYNQHMAVMSQYAELMKNLGPTSSASHLLSHLEQYTKLPKKTTQKSKKLPQQQQLQHSSATNGSQPKARLSVKQLQTMQQHPPLPNLPNHMSNPYAQLSASATTTAAKLLQSSNNPFTIPASPYMGSSGGGIVASTSSGAAGLSSSSASTINSPLRSPVQMSASPVPPQTPPGHGQISPSKTLQQILAERQRALSDANLKQQQLILQQQQQLILQQQQLQMHQQPSAAAALPARSDSVGSAASGSTTKSTARKPDNVIILD